MTNTLASREFYEKRGFAKVSERLFADGSGQKTIIYEYHVKEKTMKTAQEAVRANQNFSALPS